MNHFKKELERELQSFTLSEEKKQAIIRKVKRKSSVSWSYRLVFTAWLVLGVGFAYLLFTQESTSMNQAAKPEVSADSSLLTTDLSKLLMMIGVYLLFYLLLKVMLRHRSLAICKNCGEEWTYWQSLKASMKGEKVTCPYCHLTQIKEKEALWEMTLLHLIFPLGLVFTQFFDDIVGALVIYLLFGLIIMIRFTPYLISFQGEEIESNRQENNWNKVIKLSKRIIPIALVILVLWGSWMKEDSYPTPQEAIQEIYYNATLIPGYVLEDQALLFSITSNQLIAAHYVDKNIFGWKAKGFTSYPINKREILRKSHGAFLKERYLIYGLVEQEKNIMVQVDGEEARLLHLEMLPKDEVESLHLQGLSIWYFESEKMIDATKMEVQIIDKDTGELVETLSVD